MVLGEQFLECLDDFPTAAPMGTLQDFANPLQVTGAEGRPRRIGRAAHRPTSVQGQILPRHALPVYGDARTSQASDLIRRPVRHQVKQANGGRDRQGTCKYLNAMVRLGRANLSDLGLIGVEGMRVQIENDTTRSTGL